MRRGRVCMPVTMRGVFRRRRLQELLGVFFEFRQTVLAAEIIYLAVVLVASRSACGSTVIPQIGSVAIDTPSFHILSLNDADARPPIEKVAIFR